MARTNWMTRLAVSSNSFMPACLLASMICGTVRPLGPASLSTWNAMYLFVPGRYLFSSSCTITHTAWLIEADYNAMAIFQVHFSIPGSAFVMLS